MALSINLDQAQATLKDLVHRLSPGEEVVITENHLPVAKLGGEQPTMIAGHAKQDAAKT